MLPRKLLPQPNMLFREHTEYGPAPKTGPRLDVLLDQLAGNTINSTVLDLGNFDLTSLELDEITKFTVETPSNVNTMKVDIVNFYRKHGTDTSNKLERIIFNLPKTITTADFRGDNLKYLNRHHVEKIFAALASSQINKIYMPQIEATYFNEGIHSFIFMILEKLTTKVDIINFPLLITNQRVIWSPGNAANQKFLPTQTLQERDDVAKYGLLFNFNHFQLVRANNLNQEKAIKRVRALFNALEDADQMTGRPGIPAELFINKIMPFLTPDDMDNTALCCKPRANA